MTDQISTEEAVERLTFDLGFIHSDPCGPLCTASADDLRTLLAAYAEMKEGLAVSQESGSRPGLEAPSIYRHVRRGTTYRMIGSAEMQDASGKGVQEGAVLVFYEDDNGKVWCRRAYEFHDGRFEKLPSCQTPAPVEGSRDGLESLRSKLDVAVKALEWFEEQAEPRNQMLGGHDCASGFNEALALHSRKARSTLTEMRKT